MVFDAEGADGGYEVLRTSDWEPARSLRAFYEARWVEFERYAEHGFLDRLRARFDERAWELELGASLARRGLLAEAQRGQGPDFLLASQPPIFVEATCPGVGDINNPDRLPDREAAIQRAQNEGRAHVYAPAVTQAVLRATSSVAGKVAQYRAYKETPEGAAIPDTGLIVALSGRAIRQDAAHLDPSLPYRFLFGAGDLTVRLDAAGEVAGQHLEYEPVRFRSAGADVDCALFVTNLYPELKGILWDRGFGDMERRWERGWELFYRHPDGPTPGFEWLARHTVDQDGNLVTLPPEGM